MRQLRCTLPPNGLTLNLINGDIKFFKQMSNRFVIKYYKSMTLELMALLVEAYSDDFEDDGYGFDATKDVEDDNL